MGCYMYGKQTNMIQNDVLKLGARKNFHWRELGRTLNWHIFELFYCFFSIMRAHSRLSVYHTIVLGLKYHSNMYDKLLKFVISSYLKYKRI